MNYDPRTGSVPVLLRGEALIELGLALAAYRGLGGSWGMFALFFLVPDLSMLGYLGNPRLGAILYNAGHSVIGPALLAFAGFAGARPDLVLLGLIWVAHIGFDRALGYGLKYPAGFGVTHLGGLAATSLPKPAK